MTALLTVVVEPADKAQHDTEVAILREEMARAKENLAAEEVRMTAERAAFDARAQQLQAEIFWLSVDLNASNEVMKRRHQKTQSCLPLTYDPRNLFHTPEASPSNPPEANQITTPGAGAPVQPRAMEPPRMNTAPPHYTPIPPGHFSNPLENLIVALAHLVALPMEGDSPTTIETRRVRELLQTALAQQDAYSYSRDRIHSTPRPSRSPSYSRHMDSADMSSNAQHRNQPCRHEPVQAGALNLSDQERI